MNSISNTKFNIANINYNIFNNYEVYCALKILVKEKSVDSNSPILFNLEFKLILKEITQKKLNLGKFYSIKVNETKSIILLVFANYNLTLEHLPENTLNNNTNLNWKITVLDNQKNTYF